jgi:histidine triad (HIT) family protein
MTNEGIRGGACHRTHVGADGYRAYVSECIFCRIVGGEIPATVVRRSDRVLAFRDLNGQAPLHVLVIPIEHHDNVAALAGADPATLAELVQVGQEIADEEATASHGAFRLVFNTGAEVGQSVFHVHGHVLAGRSFAWPPG